MIDVDVSMPISVAGTRQLAPHLRQYIAIPQLTIQAFTHEFMFRYGRLRCYGCQVEGKEQTITGSRLVAKQPRLAGQRPSSDGLLKCVVAMVEIGQLCYVSWGTTGVHCRVWPLVSVGLRSCCCYRIRLVPLWLSRGPATADGGHEPA